MNVLANVIKSSIVMLLSEKNTLGTLMSSIAKRNRLVRAPITVLGQLPYRY